MDASKQPLPKKSRRHLAFGSMKGTMTIAPGVDLTEPAFPEWADLIEEKYGKGKPCDERGGEGGAAAPSPNEKKVGLLRPAHPMRKTP